MNQFQREYNALGQLLTEWQAHGGAVNTSSSPKVQYAYSAMPSGANHSRLISTTYPAPRRPRRSPFRKGAAWNRLIDYKSGSTSLESYQYDALGRRIKQGSTALYYSADWKVVEERDSGGIARVSMVWSPVYIDAMIARDRDADSNGSLEERLYVAHDANFNVSSIIGTSGRALERFILDPYGSPTFLDGSWSTLGGSAYAWTHLHQGGRQCAASSLYHFRHRELSPSLGRWMTNDPIGYNGKDLSLVRFVNGSPASFRDALGLRQPYSVDMFTSPISWTDLHLRQFPSCTWCTSKWIEMCLPDSWAFDSTCHLRQQIWDEFRHSNDGCSVPPEVALIPGFRDWMYVFKPCCDRHDGCYPTCDRHSTHRKCDMAFMKCMLSVCQRLRGFIGVPSIDYSVCEQMAYLFYAGVTVGGSDHYLAAKRYNCECRCPCLSLN